MSVAADLAREDETLRRRAWDAAAEVCDPEIPVLTIADLGVLRSVEIAEDGAVEVTITPTYSGCPAMDAIRTDVVSAVSLYVVPPVGSLGARPPPSPPRGS